MGHFRAYIDESGTPPKRGSDPPFAVACIASLGEPLDVPRPGGLALGPLATGRARSNRALRIADRLFDEVAQRRLFTAGAFLCVDADVWPAIYAKHEKLNTMARAQRLVSRANSHYLENDGINLTNEIWARGVQDVTVQAVLRAMARGPVTQVTVVVDAKTLGRGARALLGRQVHRIPDLLAGILSTHVGVAPRAIGTLARRLEFSAKTIELLWSDQIPAGTGAWGLQGADALAGLLRRDVSGDSASHVPRYDSVTDLQETLVAPISREAIADWRRSTGLPEPE